MVFPNHISFKTCNISNNRVLLFIERNEIKVISLIYRWVYYGTKTSYMIKVVVAFISMGMRLFFNIGGRIC